MVRLILTRSVVLLVIALTVGIPIGYYRHWYTREKRVRVVTEGKVYRCGQLTQTGFREVLQRYGIKTLVNLQDALPDPELRGGIKESELCRQLGVRYIWLPPQLVDAGEPVTIDQFLELCDDKNAYPIMLHCQAGLHRTGTMAAFYRIEYEGWSPEAAMNELLTCGFSLKQCTVKNPYIKNYLVDYVPRARKFGFAQRTAVTPLEESTRRP